MKNNDIKNALRACETLKSLKDNELDSLIAIGQREVFRKGEEVFTINHEGKKFYVVIEGRLTLRLKTNESKDYKKGDLFGEVAILGDTMRFGTIRATEESMLVSFDREKLFYSDSLSKNLALKTTLLLSKKIISYFDQENWISSKKLIEKGECDYVEFKNSIHRHNKSDIVRTLASFMNLNGGTIFCGVKDNGQLLGMDINQSSFDELQKMLTKEIRYKIGDCFRQYVHYDVEKIEGKKIVRIDCNSSKSPVFYKEFNNNGHATDYFVVRSGSQNITMTKTKNVIEYVQERFKNKYA